MNWQSAVERTVTGLGYDLVDAEKGVGGLLRVFIDHLPAGESTAAARDRFITVDDCERVTRQLQHVLEVDNVAYERLEVSSPGLDRPLRRATDYARFVGEQIEVTLKLPFQGRKKYRGMLQRAAEGGDGWRLVLDTGSGKAGGGAKARGGKPADPSTTERPGLALDFSLDEVREARLVPVVDFKGRRFAAPAGAGSDELAATDPAHPDEELDGDRIQ